MRKPADVRLLIESYQRMHYEEAESKDCNDEALGGFAHAIALLTFILDEPERACECGNPNCETLRLVREMHAEWNDWLMEDRGAMN